MRTGPLQKSYLFEKAAKPQQEARTPALGRGFAEVSCQDKRQVRPRASTLRPELYGTELSAWDLVGGWKIDWTRKGGLVRNEPP